MSEAKSEDKSEVKSEAKPEVTSAETKKRRPIKRFFKSFVDVKTWVSYDEVAANAKNTIGLFRRLTSRGTEEVRHETYEEALVRMNLTPEQVVARKNNFLYSAMIYGAFALGFFLYFSYLLINLHILASFLALIPTVLMLLTAYREHFWYMQMQKKKLGCSFHEWLDFVLGRKK
jgi:intracellular multiplication protein IcmV